ncbi:uncharacterized protein FA14DRAFT_156807 [Meira miltonrushii]|uniref:Uncharacterized protein n=1 Tax=Meira miltonrushii TaxID=1280837 RepID=A0A316VD29_9BASI|nr:uncharacterized protein FA14DRAFT_156807 [Meira miltonrushii]PWN34143.1 hypothetical protein FA14DRAFT_156807 [Meira miltonrushii]
MNAQPIQGLMNGIVNPSSAQHLSFQRLRKRQRHRKDEEDPSNNDASSGSTADDTSSPDAGQSTSSHRHHRQNRTRTGDPNGTQQSLTPLASDDGLSNSQNGMNGQRGGFNQDGQRDGFNHDGQRGGFNQTQQKAIQEKNAARAHAATDKTVGIAVGVVVGVIFLLFIGMTILMFFRRKREAAERQKQLDASIAAGGFRDSMTSQDEMKTVRLNGTSQRSRDVMREARKTQYIYDKDGNLEGEASVGSVGQAGWNYAHYLGAGSLVSDNQPSKSQRQLLPQQPPPAYPRSPPSDEDLSYQQYYQQQDQHQQYGQQDYYDQNQNHYAQQLYRS